MSENAPASVQGGFEHRWRATILKKRPLILPQRHYVYPREAEEVERGALELLIEPARGSDAAFGVINLVPEPSQAAPSPFLATCALGFADPLAPTGVWSCPHPDTLCAVAGGYAYLIDTQHPERFEQVAYRPVLAVHAVATAELQLLLFVGNQAISAYGVSGCQWETARLSDEGIAVHSIADGWLHGAGWEMHTDREACFTLDLRTGVLAG